ncbi:MAG: TolC family protein [Saprospiraceae bacterium]|nr:TolC family protein [Saprospiraceae bacterium]
MKLIKVFILSFLFLPGFGISQNILTLDDALGMAIQNNFNVRIAKNEAIIDKSNNTSGNAGFLPDLALNFGNTNNINNTRQEFFSGDKREGNNVKTTNINANLQLAWTVFDGMRMFVNRDRLREIESLGQLNVQIQMESVIHQVMSAYYNMSQYKKRISTIAKAIEISKERKELAELKLNVGSGSSIPVLQAEVDINADSATLIRQQLLLSNSKIIMNELLGRSPEIQFDVAELHEDIFTPDYSDLLTKTEQRNRMLLMADKNIKLSELTIKQWESNKYPTLDVNMGYNFSRLNAEIGVLKFNQNTGLSYGLTGRWNIFNGYNNKREIQVAKLSLESEKLAKEQTSLALNTDLYTYYTNYLTSEELSKIEDKNIGIAQQNLDITTQKMRIGTINALELRQAQLNLIDAEFRKITAEFDAKMSKLELKRLAGELLK